MNAINQTTTPSGSLQETCLLVVLRIHQFSTTVSDKRESTKIAKEKEANQNRYRVSKRTLVAPELKTIQEIANGARQRFKFLTRPWAADGARIIPGALWLDFSREMEVIKEKFEQAADVAALHWEDIIERNRPQLGSGFDRSDYPTAEKFRAAFSMTLSPYTFPTSDNFFSNLLDDEAVEDIRKRQEAATRAVLAEGSRQVAETVYEAVERLANRFAEYECGEDGKRQTKLHQTIVTNLRDLVKILPAMNLERDPELDRLAREIDAKLCAASVDEIKEDDHQRREVAKDAQDILTSMAGYMGHA